MINFWKVARLSRDAELRVGDFGRCVERKKKSFFLGEFGRRLSRLKETVFGKSF